MQEIHSAEAITGSKMSSPHTESTSTSLSSKPGMETQLMPSESPEDDEENPMKNPFTVPPDIDVFSIRHEEINKAKAERERMKTMKIHEKITYSTKIKAKPKGLRKALQKEEEEEARKQATNEKGLKTLLESHSWKTAIKNISDYSLGKETLRDYINNRREIFLLEYAMAVKRDEMQRMKNAAKNEERKVEKAEYNLEKNIAMFDEYLKKCDKICIQVLKNGKKQAAAKTNKTRELQAITSQIENFQSDIFRFKDTLQEYKTYRDFLYQLSPKKWQEEHGKKHTKEMDLKVTFKTNEESASLLTVAKQVQGLLVMTNAASPYHISYTDLPDSLLSSKYVELSSLYEIKPQLKSFLKSLSTRKLSSLEDAESETCSDKDEQPELYFTDPQQLLSVFTDMKEENFSFLQNSQETEESSNKLQHTFIMTYERTEKKLAELKQQVVTLKSSIAKEEERLADLKLKVHHLTSGEHKADDHVHPEIKDKMLTSLNKKVLEVYCHWTGENEANLQTLQMLALIEKQVIYLLDNLEKIPPEKLQQAEKAKDKEQRRRFREEKLRQQKQQQEEKFQKVLERLQRTMGKKSTTKLVVHSSPPVRKTHSQEQMDKEKEEQLYYFT